MPELDDTTYTCADFLEIRNGQIHIAGELYEAVSWNHLERLLEECMNEEKVARCTVCGKFV